MILDLWILKLVQNLVPDARSHHRMPRQLPGEGTLDEVAG